MRSVSVFFLIGLLGCTCAQFLNHRPFPTYSLENMPDTEFSCRDKILGGYYADVDTMCQMFHICVKVAGVGVQDFRFLCPNGTAFDQDHQICAEWEDVDCDVSTLYYSSDNFDLYRIGSGFESKAVKYGEDEETFALQKAETGDARLNREHQAQRVNQQKEQQIRRNRPQNTNNNNNDRDIFKGSSSSNFFNNRNGGKETEDDYDDNVNVNQNNDNFQKKKLIRKQNRRPDQSDNSQFDNNNQQTRKPAQNDNQNYNQQNRRPAQNGNSRQQNTRQPQNNDNRQQQNNDRPVQNNNYQNNNRQQPNNRPAQNNDFQNRQPPNNRPQNNNNRQQANNRPQNNNYQNNDDYHDHRQQQQHVEAQTYRPNRPTGFVNNFAGSSYVPTTSRPTTNNAENFGQNQNSPTSSYTISTPAPFKQTQQYNNPPNRQPTQNNYNNGHNPTTQAPQKETENYPTHFSRQPYIKPTENYPSSSQKKQIENYPTQPSVNKNSNNQFSTHYDIPKIKPTEISPTQASPNRNNQFSNQYNAPKNKPTENYPTQPPFRNNQNNNQFSNAPAKGKVTENYPTQPPTPRVTQYNTHYDVPRVKPTKQTENYPTTAFRNSENYPNQFNKKPTTPFKQNDNYPTTFAPKFNKSPSSAQSDNSNNYPSTFAPRTNSGYTQISQQTTHYNSKNNYNQQQNSTPRTTPFTPYTPTVPKITSTTPVPRSNRFDETQYDDGSYNSKYDRSDDEFLKTAHSQNIASSRNEYSKSTKDNASPSTQKPHFESPRPFSVSPNTPKSTDQPKTTARPVENRNFNFPSSNKKVKDASYDYAYYDTNVGSEPEYEIDTEIKKANVKN